MTTWEQIKNALQKGHTLYTYADEDMSGYCVEKEQLTKLYMCRTYDINGSECESCEHTLEHVIEIMQAHEPSATKWLEYYD